MADNTNILVLSRAVEQPSSVSVVVLERTVAQQTNPVDSVVTIRRRVADPLALPVDSVVVLERDVATGSGRRPRRRSRRLYSGFMSR